MHGGRPPPPPPASGGASRTSNPLCSTMTGSVMTESRKDVLIIKPRKNGGCGLTRHVNMSPDTGILLNGKAPGLRWRGVDPERQKIPTLCQSYKRGWKGTKRLQS
ncbi:uncharacterized protein LOC117878086 isoform X3 [Trachemys scripta elegans]|uniref:uncharacterized protein LOC117878086 isoform X3 n=1 Tax=Trachemys scripta elegans TaxID=31138 RepID=UPI0015520512|nr:uncharacterized protein LOC117878086 isoform X3 [Trachemys scripta elegans]